MCKAVEDYANSRRREGIREGRRKGKLEGKLETVKNMLKDGLALEKALEYVNIDKDTYYKHCADMADA